MREPVGCFGKLVMRFLVFKAAVLSAILLRSEEIAQPDSIFAFYKFVKLAD